MVKRCLVMLKVLVQKVELQTWMMDEIEEIRQLTLLLYVEQDTGIAEVTNDLCKL